MLPKETQSESHVLPLAQKGPLLLGGEPAVGPGSDDQITIQQPFSTDVCCIKLRLQGISWRSSTPDQGSLAELRGKGWFSSWKEKVQEEEVAVPGAATSKLEQATRRGAFQETEVHPGAGETAIPTERLWLASIALYSQVPQEEETHPQTHPSDSATNSFLKEISSKEVEVKAPMQLLSPNPHYRNLPKTYQ